MAERAAMQVAAYIRTFPGASVAEVAGRVHADDAAFLQRQLQQTRDQRAGNIQQFASVPPSSGTPQMASVEIPRLTQEQMRGKSLLGATKAVAADLKRMAGL